MVQKTMGGINLTGYFVNQVINTALDAPRPCHWWRTSTSLDLTSRPLQQHIAVGELGVVWNTEMFQQASYQWLPGPEPGRTKITIGTSIIPNCQNSASEPIPGFDHACVYRRWSQLPSCGEPAKPTADN
jgi:hypothetical protein